MNIKPIKATKLPDLVKQKDRIDRFTFFRRIGSGTFGQVFRGNFVDEETGFEVECAIKVESLELGKRVLQSEHKIMLSLSQNEHFPKIYGCLKIPEKKISMFAMQLGEGTLKDFANRNYKKRIPNSLVMHIMVNLIDAIKFIHSIGYLHRDIKSGNVIVIHMKNCDYPELKIIDFGLARRYMDGNALRKKRRDGKVSFRGTKLYASINQLMKNEFTRADDLINLMYSMIALFSKQSFPWTSESPLKTQIKLRKQYKIQFTNNIELTNAMEEYYRNVCDLKFEDKPDYEKLLSLFRQLDKTSNNSQF